MLRDAGGMRNKTEIEGGGVVVFHGKLVVRVIFIHQANPLDRVSGRIQLPENIKNVPGDMVVDDHLAFTHHSVQIHVEHM